MEDSQIPSVDAPIEEKLLFLQENMSNFVKQYSLPVVEVALVISKYIKILLSELTTKANTVGETLPIELTQPWEIDTNDQDSLIDSFPIERVLSTIDQDRMDIFDTIIRTILNNAEIPLINGLTLLRDWESVTRKQLVNAASPGHLFSPFVLPDNF
ncbi:MAG: hypothetical protein HN534_02610 [Euryarchaeota archaeon]|jgi:hypothetical protein|nr:hypothetical protein [Euryarchaeota archaeon]MBT3653806.1 hypothetical protein [Euryarchaeota archaeon]MBT3758084.1 hypothetical protein [Euryarchaeota archaeon]MBT4050167.1 hypothetical protein [Euryarchaeota archaeon]MBT4346845.1 hypothetical protein [Euryarchaeota archaeon]